MAGALHQSMTIDEFLAWERRQEPRYEFDGFGPVAMTGSSIAHSIIGSNLVRALEDRLRGKPCRAFRGDVKIIVAGRVRYPDALVTCTPVSQQSDIVPEPVVVFEIISPGNASTDRITKNNEYRGTPSILRYVMLEQVRMAATVFTREGDDWVGRVVSGDAALAMTEVGIELPLAELYPNVELPDVDLAE